MPAFTALRPVSLLGENRDSDLFLLNENGDSNQFLLSEKSVAVPIFKKKVAVPVFPRPPVVRLVITRIFDVSRRHLVRKAG